ncbi:MAG: hypothetical protein Q9166_003092 [cf. Caloplaca sp. 2 TL-2023]
MVQENNGPPQWKHVRHRYCRMQYRDGPDEDWQQIEDSYESERPKDNLLEPWNVEQLCFRPGGIDVRQMDGPTNPQVGEQADRHTATVHFKNPSHIVISEYQAPNPSVPGQKIVHCSVRFRCIQPARCTIQVTQESSGHMPTEKGATVKTTDTTAFPLARMHRDTDSFRGKEIRLGFSRGSAKRNRVQSPSPQDLPYITTSPYALAAPLPSIFHHASSTPSTAPPSSARLSIRYTIDELLARRPEPVLDPRLLTRLQTADFDLRRRSTLSPTFERKYDEVEKPAETIQAKATSLEAALIEQRTNVNKLEQEAQEAKQEAAEAQRRSTYARGRASVAQTRAEAMEAELRVLEKEYIRFLEDEWRKSGRQES